MKFNWGTGLVIFFILFVGTLIFIVFKSRQINDSLVLENYYDEDIAYQQTMDKKQNTADLSEKVRVEYSTDERQISLVFPPDSTTTAPTKGKVVLYSPVSNRDDMSYEFDLGQDLFFRMPAGHMRLGRWKVKLDWSRNSKSFYQEDEIFIK